MFLELKFASGAAGTRAISNHAQMRRFLEMSRTRTLKHTTPRTKLDFGQDGFSCSWRNNFWCRAVVTLIKKFASSR